MSISCGTDGIRVEDIDFDQACIDICRGSQYIPNQGTRETALKTEATYRTITIPSALVNMLLEYKEWQDNEKAKAEDLWIDCDRLFVDDYGKPLNPDSMYQWWARFLKRNGLRHISLHALRHTSISSLISNGADIVETSRRAGHSNITTTLDIYSHLYKKLNRNSADIFERELYKK